VVFGGDDRDDARLQQIAAEFNLSETVFVLRPTQCGNRRRVRLRWFTPRCEVGFCGHASLAAVHAYCEISGESSDVDLECAVGNLRMQVESAATGMRYWLTMPDPALRKADFSTDMLFQSLRIASSSARQASAWLTRDRDIVVLLACGDDVRNLKPEMGTLDSVTRHENLRGVCVASLDTGDTGVACISRFFAPAAGIPEDPVTGSVHGPLGTLLIERFEVPAVDPERWAFRCQQLPANGRVGEVQVRAQRREGALAVEVGGACCTVMRGHVVV
jgi:PhzF family phenazine biosynthesis protein